MKRLILAAGVAALAIAAPATAERGAKGGQQAHSGKVERDKAQTKARGGGKAKVQKADRGGRSAKVKRSGGREMRLATMQAQRGGRDKIESKQRGKSANAKVRVEQRGRSDDRKLEARQRIEPRRTDRRRIEVARDRRDDRRLELRDGNRRVVLRDRDVVGVRTIDRDRLARRFAERGYPAGFAGGCPPGLAKQNELCMPPGQYKKLVGQRVSRLRDLNRVPVRLRDIYRDTDDYYYRYGNGYIYRVDRDRDLIRSVLPLFGLGYAVGEPFPFLNSPAYYVPSAYQPFYPSYGDDYYRYNNGLVYEIDGRSGLIEDIIPLYNSGYGLGQMLPSSYSYYNVPYPYRSYYVDNDDYYYRYAPGAIYQVDPQTRLITAIVSLLTGGSNGLSIGQPLPLGYSAYNVPYDYRTRYYDTPDAWYRYSNGYIYQVDPQTQLIRSIVASLV